MKIIFLGVGEATEDRYPNNSCIILSESKILLDAGYSVARQFWTYNSNPDFLDAVYISHGHADHYFGLPQIIARMAEDGRKKPLTIICSKEVKKNFIKLFDYAYKDFYKKIPFKTNYLEVDKGKKVKFNEFGLSFARTIHSVKNLAIRIEKEERVFCYSGDGMFSEESKKLYNNCDLLIHEAYFLNQEERTERGHVPLSDLVKMVKEAKVKCLALTHINRNLRKNRMNEINNEIKNKGFKIIVPEPLDEYNI